MRDHPAPFLFVRFINGDLSAEETRSLVRHLLSGCKRCLAGLAPAAGVLVKADTSETVAVPADDYELPIRKAFEAVALHGAKAPAIKSATRKLYKQMAVKGLESVSLKGYPDHAIFEALLQRIQDLRHEDPKTMVQYGRIAVQTARAMVKDFSQEEQADFQARALVELANALRVADDLNEARRHLDSAEQWYAAGTQCEILWLRLLDIRASLYGAQQHYQDAIGLLDDVIEGRLRLGDRPGTARALIKKGIFTAYAGRHQETFGLFDRALGLIDMVQEPALARLALHNKILFTVEAAQFADAALLLEQHRQALAHEGGRLDRVKLLGLEARIQAGLGHFDLAEPLLQEAKQALAELEVRGHEALASLDLAAVILHQSRSRYFEAVSLAIEALKTFTQLQVKPQVIEALNVLVHAIQEGIVTAVLLQSVADFMRKAEHDRRARYQARFE